MRLYNSFFTLLRVFVSLNLAEISDDYVKSLVDMLKECGEIYSREKALPLKLQKISRDLFLCYLYRS
jgi:hypothetical protein